MQLHGRYLSQVLANSAYAGEAHLRGFMRTGAALVAEGSGRMLGTVLEQMAGITMDKQLLASRKGMLDAFVIQSMLQQVR